MEILSDSGAPAKSRETTADQPSLQAPRKDSPALRIVTARFGHRHHGRPLILAGTKEVAWCTDPKDAEMHREFLLEQEARYPGYIANAAEEATDYCDSPSLGWRA